MAREYNYIYCQLVEDRSDIVGHVAYSLYKADKVQFINKFKEENGREPKEGELKPFHDTSCLEGSLNGYKNLAIDLLRDFLDNTLAESVHQAEEECQRAYKENIKDVITPILPPSKARVFWNGVLQSVVGAFVFALLIAAIAFVIQFKSADITVNFNSHPQETESVTANE